MAPSRKLTSALVVIAVVSIFGIGIVAATVDFSSSTQPNAGRVPSTAVRADGSIDRDQIPDLVTVENHAGEVVGYARKDDLFPSQGSEPSAPSPVQVWDRSGSNLVGHVYPDGVGFLSLDEQSSRGISPDAPPRGVATVTTVVEG